MGFLLESSITEALCVVLLLLWALYKNVTKQYTYWQDRGVPHVTPKFPFGTFHALFLGKVHMGQMYDTFYQQFKGERYFGIYDSRKPIFVARDPELIKHILTKDFNSFTDRFVFPINKKADYISAHLFNMTGQEWKKMRLKLTPTFTSGKMKEMFFFMEKCSEQLRDHVDSRLKNDSVIDVKDVLTRFTMDVIASCAFGLEINSLSDNDCEFYIMGMQIFKPDVVALFRRIFFSMFPILTKIITFRFISPEISGFLTRIVRETVEYREKNLVNRNDFLNLLIKIRQNKSLLVDDEQLKGHSELDKTGLTIEEMTAQCFIFFIAGFETASSTMTFCLHELACNPDIQQKVYEEVNEVLGRHEGRITYQALQEMNYMDMVINETLRRYASLAVLNRVCTESFKVPDSDLVLEKGMRVTIPTFAIHHDPDHYPDPYKFDPERFNQDNIRERHPYLHLPFGEGPRMCIGMRFGLLQTKIGLTMMLSNFLFGLTPDTQIPVTIHKRSFVTQPEKPILLTLVKRKTDC